MIAKVRPATVSDAEAIADVHVTSWRESYRGLVPSAMLDRLSVKDRANHWRTALRTDGASNPLPVFVASSDKKQIVGFGACGRQRSGELDNVQFDGEFQAIYVLAAFQRYGLGRALMIEMAKTLIQSGCHGGSLWVLRDNHPARRFYEALNGSVLTGREEKLSSEIVLQEVAYGWSHLSMLANCKG